ncbi:ABC transporter permease subunit [Microbacteriaceae bacterium]|nr:ABC transporter permease subunit [Candidatus Saccharibacteria bacterium]
MKSVYTKALYDRRSFIIGWTVALTAISILMTSFYPAMHQEGVIDQLMKQMPPALQGLIGNLNNLSHFDTYIAAQLFDIRISLIAGIMSIILALGLSTREEESGELRTILALPVSRTKMLFQKWLALCTIMAVTAMGLVVGIYAVLPFIDNASIEYAQMARLVAMTILIMICYGTITFAAGMASGKRAVASFVGVFTIIGSFLLSTFSVAVDWLKDYEKFSLLNYFPAVDIVSNGIELRDVIVLTSIIIITLGIAWVLFRQRDIA